MIIFGLITISSWRLILCKFETLEEVASTLFSQTMCTGSISVVECSRCEKMAGVGRRGAKTGVVQRSQRVQRRLRGQAQTHGLGCVVFAIDELSGFVLTTAGPHLPLSFSTSTSPSTPPTDPNIDADSSP